MQNMIKLMKHVAIPEFGAPSVMKLGECPLPTLKAEEILVEIHATSINRADTLQRAGKYNAPKGASPILGLECAGFTLDEQGKRQERIMTILGGGGYAQYAAVNKNHIIRIPEKLSFEQAGGIAEAYLTAFLQIRLANIKQGDSCLIYAAASGVGQATLQICKRMGIVPIASCSKEKFKIVQKYTNNIIDRQEENILEQIKQIVPQGVDAVFDCVGQQNWKLSIDSLKMDGRWIVYGLLSGGIIQNFNLAQLLAKRIVMINTTLRSRSDEFKTELVTEFQKQIMPWLSEENDFGIDRICKVKWDEQGVQEIVRLHEEMESNRNSGKMNVIFEQ